MHSWGLATTDGVCECLVFDNIKKKKLFIKRGSVMKARKPAGCVGFAVLGSEGSRGASVNVFLAAPRRAACCEVGIGWALRHDGDMVLL